MRGESDVLDAARGDAGSGRADRVTVPLLEEDGHRLGSEGRRGVDCFGFVPAPTPATLLEAAWLEQARLARMEGADPGRVPLHRWSRWDARAVDEARAVLSGMVSRQASRQKRVRRERLRDEEGQLPLGSPAPIDILTRDFNTRPLVPWHQTSIGRAGVLTTMVAGSGTPGVPGPPVGLDAYTRELFTFDCWGTYTAGMTKSPDVFSCGFRGEGKSYGMKCLAVAEIGYGRCGIVQSDRQGEWVRLAEAIPGGQVVSPGAGHFLNPFAQPDDSHLRNAQERAEFRQEVLASRKSAMKALAEAVRQEGRPSPLDTDMLALIDEVITSFGIGPMTLTAAVDRLSDWDWVDSVHEHVSGFAHYRELARDKASAAARVFSPMVHGGTMSGWFDQESTIQLDPMSPLIVFDTSSNALQNDDLKRVYTAAVSAWIDHLLQARDGQRRFIVAEEAWDLLSNEQLVESLQARQRSAGHWGCSTWMIVHGVADMTNVFQTGSRLRGMVEQLMNLTETKIIYRQTGDHLDMLRELIPSLSEDEIDLIPVLPQGHGIWRIGEAQPRQVLPVPAPRWRGVFDTSGLRRG